MILKPITPFLILLLVIAACAPANQPQTFRATPVAQIGSAPVYTHTPTFTPSPTRTPTPTPTITPSLTPTETQTPSPAPTQPLWTLTPPVRSEIAPLSGEVAAPFAPTAGWSCEDFPCEDDIDGFLRRIRVPDGFHVEHVGRFPGQPIQITYGNDGRLYATVLENGTRSGAVYAMNDDGSTERYSGTFVSPFGLAFQPGTDVLYVSARVTLESGGGVWRVPPGGGDAEPVIANLPCCYSLIDNQPNGMIFGADGYLYLGVGALSDHAENATRSEDGIVRFQPYEASILRIQPHTGDVEVYASGIRNPVDLAVDSSGALYATDSGLITGQGDRLLMVEQGGHYGFPYWRERGCESCPIKPARVSVSPDLIVFPPLSLPRGVVAYTGAAYPSDLFDDLFVVLWNAVDGGQRVVRVDPETVPTDPEARAAYTPDPFVTGLIRPIDVALDPNGALVVADYVYGHVWRVVYDAGS